MNVASLELCKELYELSGWNPESHIPDGKKLSEPPAYDLGYLLRKLPPKTLINKYSDTYLAALADPEFHEARADTPEDAACKLAIELFKQGVLHVEGE